MLKKIDKWVSYAENAMLVIGMLSTTFILFANVIMRFCFKSVWSNEYANYAIIWIVCGGCGACVRSDAHMRITAIPDMIKNEKVKQVLALIVYVICLAFSVVILTSGSRLVGSMMANNQKSAAMQISLWWIYLSFPVGGGVMTFRFLLKLIDSVKELIGKGGAQA
mgnify:CR=1 FL=1